MVVRVNLPNVKQPITDSSGYITKAHFDFLRKLWLRTGGNQDNISNIEDDISSADLFIFRDRFRELEKRIADLEKELTALS